MAKLEIVALRSTQLSWSRLFEVLPSVLDTLGLALVESTGAGEITFRDHGSGGCLILLDSGELARRAARAFATAASVSVEGFEAVGTGSEKGFKFRTAAFKATATGELKDAEGTELDFDDTEQDWGGGNLEARTTRVLRDFGELATVYAQTKTVGYKRRPAGRPSTPRVATLLATLKKGKSHEARPQDGGRVELRIALAAGGTQTSFCTAAEYEELQKLLGGRKG